MKKSLDSDWRRRNSAGGMGILLALALASTVAWGTAAQELDQRTARDGLGLTIGANVQSSSSSGGSTMSAQLSLGSAGKSDRGVEIEGKADSDLEAGVSGGAVHADANAGVQGEVRTGKRGGNGRPPRGGAPVPEPSTWIGMFSLLALCFCAVARHRRR